MTLAEMSALAQDATFRARVRANAVRYARVVIAETETGKAGFTEKRWLYAQAVLADGGLEQTERLAWGVACASGFKGAPEDADIDSAIQLGWNDFAGVYGKER